MANRRFYALAFLAFAFSTPAVADANHEHGTEIGQPAKAPQAARTVEVELRDVSFEPRRIEVKAGETVHFKLKNTGQLLHEFNIGTPAMHQAHQKEMQQMLDAGMMTATSMDMSKHGGHMNHDDPNAVLLEPGKSAELTWTFPKATTLEFACNIPGHYEAGMVGEIEFGQ